MSHLIILTVAVATFFILSTTSVHSQLISPFDLFRNPADDLLNVFTSAPTEATVAPISGNYRCKGNTAKKIQALIRTRFNQVSCAVHNDCVSAAAEMKRWVQSQHGGTFQVMVMQKTKSWDWSFMTESLQEPSEENPGEMDDIYCEIEAKGRNGNDCFAAIFKTGTKGDGFVPEED